MSLQPAIGLWDGVFNTPLECGLRSSVLLLAAYPSVLDVQRLTQYDYLLVHSGDVEGGPRSIHPATPQRSGELIVRRALIEAGLEFMISRRVVDRTYTTHGIGYQAGEYSVLFVESLESNYTKELRDRAKWIMGRFQSIADDEFGVFMRNRWSKWGAEFLFESLLSEGSE